MLHRHRRAFSALSDQPHLPRRIGLVGAVVLSFNGAVAASIFALPATLAADFGNFSPLLFPVVAFAALLIVIPFTRTAAAFPHSGGPAAYGAVFGRLVGFELGWIYYIARAAAFAANANVLSAYLSRWIAGADEGLLRAGILISVTAVFAVVNIAGVRKSIGLLSGLTVLKAVPLFLAAGAAIALTFPWPMPTPAPTLTEFEAGLLIVLYAFVGFEQAVVPAGETRNPGRNLPRAIFITIAVTTLLYFLVQLAFVSALPGGASDDKSPLIDLGAWLAGPAGAAALTLAAIASLAGSLHGIMTSTPRVSYALADRGDLPRWFGRVQPRFETPANSILFFAVFAVALAISGSFVWLAVVSTLARMIVYAVTIAALPRAPGQGQIAIRHWVLGAIGIAVCIWAASQADAKAWLTLGGLSALGLLLYAVAARGSASSTREADVSAIQPPPSNREPS
ncbi:MAG TPA: APC family permease [Sphingomicrobium sp.]|nr:APC family permease [Sphingomicrobium sp.]